MKKEDPPASLVAMNYNGGSITLNIHLSSSSEKHPSKNLCHHPSRAKRLTQCLTCFEIPFLRVQAWLIRVIYGDSDRLSDKYCNPETNSLHLYQEWHGNAQKVNLFFVKCLISSLTFVEVIT